MNDSSADKPKIIVDEDWKGQVQAEKENLRQAGSAQETTARQPGEQLPIPEASFSTLAMTLVTQATYALGQAGAPEGQDVPVDLDMAKHIIDTLAVLEEKTKGNLTPEESGLLNEYLYQLRMLFVAVQTQVKQQRQPQEEKGSLEIP